MAVWQKILGILVAGGLGSLARYSLSSIVQKVAPSHLPLGTLCVNILGCGLFGFLWALMEHRTRIGPEWRAVILTGFMGAFTTFSTFVFDTHELLRLTHWMQALSNLLVQILVGLAFLMFGLWLGRHV